MPCCSFFVKERSTQSVALLRYNRAPTKGNGLEVIVSSVERVIISRRSPLARTRYISQGQRVAAECIKVVKNKQVSRPETSMGRTRWWRGGSELLVLFILHQVILGDGDVGCLFSKSLCDPETETCYNDLAFGRCLPLYTDLNDKDYYQYNFNVDELELLRLQLERLQVDEYKWSHPYTQCIMQTSLYNLRHGENYDLRLCQHLMQPTRVENKHENGQVPTIAIVKFTPNNGKYNNQFASELYYPPGVQNQYFGAPLYNDDVSRTEYNEQPKDIKSQFYRAEYSPNSYNEYDSQTNEEVYDEGNLLEKTQDIGGIDDRLYRTRRQPYTMQDYDDIAMNTMNNVYEGEELPKKFSKITNLNPAKGLAADELEFVVDDKSVDYENGQKDERDADVDIDYDKAFSRKYKPRKFTELPDRNEYFLENVKRNSKDDYDSDDYDNVNDDQEEFPQRDSSSTENGIYTEGGLVQLAKDKSNTDTDVSSENDKYDALFDDDLSELLWRRGLAGFKRRERLDVKKPGPPFSTNNYAFKTPSPSVLENENHSDHTENEQDNNVYLSPYVKKEVGSGNQGEGTKSYKNVDLDHVYVEFQQPFHRWSEGEHVVKEVSKLLDLTPGTLKDIRVGRAEVTFKVTKNNKNYNATDVLNSIDDIRSQLKETLGVEVIRAGIGDKTKLPATLEVVGKPEMSSSMFGGIVAAGAVAAVAAAALTLIIARRHAKSRAKLAGLTTPDPESSKDYQDLCRARMHAKQPSEKPESPRITSLSRESESNNMHSNRSSTSSWGEEAALTNMDISTGQMVLSYMEDRLTNKDLLDHEWTTLCMYEMDSSSTETAQNEANAGRNRPGAPLPYDHSRVILNDLANANNSDYINASTITDHDPRNPAYIATQGPLPETTADFWQLVWEQGSVVIVMLTRLTEEGVGMCHRYWPEKGSELYHIYEVHLVSEHFWCDDYLVRSFYLKNLRTHETRTVTQFHFLSWPENDVPHSTKALLEFRRKINKSYKGRSCPIIVHCSDGASRTGTYCLIDMVLNRMMKGAKEIDIAATLEHIRDQRPDMVSTKEQFTFVLTAVAEEVHAILKALPVPPAEKSTTTGNNSSPKEGQ